AEYAAPGLIELFASRANDIEVELSVRPTDQLAPLVQSRVTDVAIGPAPSMSEGIDVTNFLKYQLVAVVASDHPLTPGRASPGHRGEQAWLLGPSVAAGDAMATEMLHGFEVPEQNQRIFQSHAAALEECKRGRGVALAVSFAVSDDVAAGRLVPVNGR